MKESNMLVKISNLKHAARSARDVLVAAMAEMSRTNPVEREYFGCAETALLHLRLVIDGETENYPSTDISGLDSVAQISEMAS